jgi:hypothetical protein
MTKARDIASANPAPSTVSATELGYLDGVTSAIQTQVDAKTAKSTLTTTGDIYYASSANTPARLGIGSTGNVLTVASGVPSWAAPAGGSGLTLIQRSSFSNVANTGTTFDDVFTSTYKGYFLAFETIFASTYTDDLQIQFRYAGPTTQAAQYYAYSKGFNSGGDDKSTSSTNASQMTIASNAGASANYGSGQFYVFGVGNSSEPVNITGQYAEGNDAFGYTFYGVGQTPRTYTGFLLKSSSTNITGTVAIYGLAK